MRKLPGTTSRRRWHWWMVVILSWRWLADDNEDSIRFVEGLRSSGPNPTARTLPVKEEEDLTVMLDRLAQEYPHKFLLHGRLHHKSTATATKTTPISEEPRRLWQQQQHRPIVPHQYIVVLNDHHHESRSSVASQAKILLGLDNKLPRQANATGNNTISSSSFVETTTPRLLFLYEHALRGFTVTGMGPALLARLLLDDQVKYITPDAIVQLPFISQQQEEGQHVPISSSVVSATSSTGTDQDRPPSWGLDRLDQTSLPLNNNYHYDYTGAGVQAYILDTGIMTTHSEFQSTGSSSRASCAANYISTETCQDLQGHGTHVAGTVGGNTFGVAKQVTLFTVKVLDQTGSGTDSSVLSGVNFVATQKKNNPSQAMVANLSVGGSYSQPLNDAVTAAVAAGVVVIVAAGNDNTDACTGSPSSTATALTVAASTKSDARASFSNFGPCLDLFAPGSAIVSCGISSNSASVTLSGTSMAAPHVTGAAVLWLQKYPGSTPDQIRTSMLAAAVTNKITNAGTGSANFFVQIPLRVGPIPPTAPSPPFPTPVAPIPTVPAPTAPNPPAPIPTAPIPTAPIPTAPVPVAVPTLPTAGSGVAWINEFHYDNSGTDVGEFVEIMATVGTDLPAWSVVFYNGAGGVTYDTLPLSSGTLTTAGSVVIMVVDAAGLQNGSPDGLALINPAGAVVQFLSYEGVLTATNGPAMGLISTDVFAAEDGTTPVGYSLQVTGAGCSLANFSSWTGPIIATRGEKNTDQTIQCAGSPPTAPIAPVSPPVMSPAAPAPSPTIQTGMTAWINEFHYDNAGTDVGEFVEVMSTADTSLVGWQVYLYDGFGGNTYATINILSAIKVESVYVASVNATAIQNGPDGLALVTPSGDVVEFLSYEGSFLATDGPALGLGSVKIPVIEDSTTPIGASIQRTGTGCSIAAFAGWTADIPNTRDAVNTGQSIQCTSSPITPVAPSPVSAPSPMNGSSAWINEFHYDNAGADANEFVEVMATPDIDLSGWQVVLYNGNGGTNYATLSLPSGTLVGQVKIAVVPAPGIQNGSPDGLALISPKKAVVEFLSYEGDFMATDGPAAGMISTDILLAEDGITNNVTSSLQRVGTGCSLAAFDRWNGPISATQGMVNTGQTVTCSIFPSPVFPPTAPVKPPSMPVSPPTAPPVSPMTPPTTPVNPVPSPTVKPGPCPVSDSCIGGYWVHRLFLFGYCKAKCVPLTHVLRYIHLGFQCGSRC